MTTIKRILCPIDFSEASQHALDHALAIASWYKASVSALHVNRPSVVSGPNEMPSDERLSDVALTQLQATIDAWIEMASPRGTVVDVLFGTGQPAPQIL